MWGEKISSDIKENILKGIVRGEKKRIRKWILYDFRPFSVRERK